MRKTLHNEISITISDDIIILVSFTKKSWGKELKWDFPPETTDQPVLFGPDHWAAAQAEH